jgi:uncharacterized protein involved in exopolysaccharide biosynthesis
MSKVKECIKVLWRKIDFLVYLFFAACIGGVLAWNASQAKFIHDQASWQVERTELYDRIKDVRTAQIAACQTQIDGVRQDYKERAQEWRDQLSDLATQVQNANHNADNCHAQIAALVPKVNSAVANSQVSAKKSTEAADAATAEHAQSTLLRKYGK